MMVTQKCPSCGQEVSMEPYDIGSGPELSCGSCEWCWGAEGQDLKPLDIDAILKETNERRIAERALSKLTPVDAAASRARIAAHRAQK